MVGAVWWVKCSEYSIVGAAYCTQCSEGSAVCSELSAE